MAFAPVPEASYLSDAARTEGEMKTGFENWLLATKQTAGHGGGRLVRTSATLLTLAPSHGNRMLVGQRSVVIPPAGYTITNAGLLASTAYWVGLADPANDGVVSLLITPATTPYSLVTDPETGVTTIAGTAYGSRVTLVGDTTTDASAQFGAYTTSPQFPSPPTPILSSLAVNGAITLATDQWLSSSGGDSLIRAGATHSVSIGAGSTTQIELQRNTSITGDLSLTGTLTSKHAVRAAVIINGDTGAIQAGFGVSASSRLLAGAYQLTLSAALSGLIVTASPVSTQFSIVTVEPTGATTIVIRCTSAAGVYQDTWFHLLVVGT
jgi:hypothetical protein